MTKNLTRLCTSYQKLAYLPIFIQHTKNTSQELAELYKAHNSGRQIAALHALQAVLFVVARKLETVFIVADALGECPNDGNLKEELLELVKNMCIQSSLDIHLLVTSL